MLERFGTIQANKSKKIMKSTKNLEIRLSNYIFDDRKDISLKKCHSFDSYKGHRLFESKIKIKYPAHQYFYDGDCKAKDMNFYRNWKTQNHINMQKTTDRP